MRLALMRLQTSNAPPGKPAKGSLDAALAKVIRSPVLRLARHELRWLICIKMLLPAWWSAHMDCQ